MLPEPSIEELPYFTLSDGIAVRRHIETESGVWCPAVPLPYYRQADVLKVVCCLPEHGFDKACPVDAAKRWAEFTDFFVMRGVMLYGYRRLDGYLPIYLGDLRDDEANLIAPSELDRARAFRNLRAAQPCTMEQ